MVRFLQATIAAAVLLASSNNLWICRADLQPVSRFDTKEETFERLLVPPGKDADRRLQDAACQLEDTFLYDTSVTMNVFGSTSQCTEPELDEIGVVLTEAHQNVLHVDPRLDAVVELLVNMCEAPTAQEAQRKLVFKSSKNSPNGNGYGFNWGGSGRCRWCPPDDDDCDHGCRFRRLFDNVLGREDMSSRREHRKLQTGSIDGFKLWSTHQQSNPNLLKQLEENDVIDLQLYGTDNFSIEAMFSGDVSKVQFFFDEYSRREGRQPFFLAGDGGSYDYIYTVGPIGDVGTHTITAIPISRWGDEGKPLSLTFSTVVEGGLTASSGYPYYGVSSTTSTVTGVSGFKLWNTDIETNPQSVKDLVDGDEIDLHMYGNKLSIEAEVSPEVIPEVEYVEWYLDDSYFRTESMPPYFISGDGGSYAAGVLTTYEIGYVGTYTVEARPHDRNGRRLTAHTVTFTVVDTSTATGSGATTTATVPASTTPGEITGFKLWNTTDQAHPQFIKLLEQNENIDIQLYGSHFTVEAEVVGDVVKVNFGLDENTLYKEEYQAPFVLNGDAEYQFLATTPALSNIGLHTVTATPFSSSNSQLTQASISFSIIDTSAGMLSVSSDEEEDGYVTGFLLWDTSVPTTPKFLKKIQHSDVVDIQQYGDQLSIEAEYTGHLSKIVFGLDGNDNYHVENYEPYLLGGDSDTTYYPTPELAIVGTHTITATPFDLSGVSLPTVSFSFLTVDGSTNAGSMAAPGTRQDLIEMLEDDLSFFLSGVVNAKYFLQSGHCLQWNLVYVKVEITEVSDTMCQAPERRRLRQSVASPAAS